MSKAAFAAFALTIFSSVCLAQGPTDPIVRAGATQKLSDHVYVIPDNSVGGVPNVGIIVGSRAALVVDTGLGERNGKTVLAEAQKVASGKALYLVTTHVHPEHDLGASAFPASTKMIRSNDQVREIADNGMAVADIFRNRSPAMKELLEGAQFRKADITFEQEHVLDLGGVSVRIIALGLNHTAGDTAIFVGADGVLFSGDVAMKGGPAFASPSAKVSHWLASLDRLDALKPKIVVPSHGPMGDAAFMTGYRKLFTAVQSATVAAKKRGENVEDAVKSVTTELSTQFPGVGQRMGAAIRSAHAEAR